MHLMRGSVDFRSFEAEARRRQPRLALVLGSGLSGLVERLAAVVEVPFADVPQLDSGATVAGHRGSMLLGTWAEQVVLVFAGRLHYYEGHPWPRVVRPVQLAHELGVRALVVTNAAGGIRADLASGTLMALNGHLDCTQPHWWRAAQPIQTHDGALLQTLQEAAQVALAVGIYAQVTGPSYETPAEVRALRACGADAVGMSTAREIEAATALGMRCVGLSCITNRAAGLSDGPISHDEVLATNALQQERLGDLLEAFLGRLDGTP
jgi:purine-nucleoside phosphorylase